ncbi:MAG: hypothetical protein ACRYF7_10125 [Janthinobacterium lividum]|jgi:hypothetical protein
MNFVITDEMLDLTVLVGVIFGTIAAGFIAHGEIQRRRGLKSWTKETNTRRRRKLRKAAKNR